ncbi:hypothetical protein PR048_010420 [Dryococelus australis]|uniref:CCHC-type domain-containing protein n=1 Tax=Dryococelus australis TaxID=614101 RepID=A0ABQ9I2P6_9NEOP|nr:hypothetical protein PR048_010420 [Dryococelus australis]
MFNHVLFICTALVTMASKVTVEALNHQVSRLEGLERENSHFKRQVVSTPVNLNGDRLDLSGTALMHVRNFTLLLTIPVFSGKLEDNVGVFFIKIEQAANVCSWSENEQLAFVKLRLAVLNYEELKKHLLERFSRKKTTRFYREQLSHLKILDHESVEEFADMIRKINANTYELGSNNERNEAIKHETDQRAPDAFLNGLKGELGKFTLISGPQTFKEALESVMNVVEADKQTGKEPDSSSVFAVKHNGDRCFFCYKVGHKTRDCRKRAKACFYESDQRRVNKARYHMLLLTRILRDWISHESQFHVKCIPATVSGDDLNDLTVSVTYRGRPLKLLIYTSTQVSLMSQHVVGDLDLQCLQEPKFVVSGISSHKLKNLEKIIVSLKLGNTAYGMSVQVVQNDCTLLVNVAKQSLQLGNKLYSLGQCTDGPTSRSSVHLVAAEKILPGTGKIVCIMVSLPSVYVENNCTILVEPACECDVLNNQHCYVARSVTTVMPHEGKVEAPVNIVYMSRAEIAVLELLDKGDVLSCPFDVGESVVSENMNQSGSLQDVKCESLLQDYQYIFRERKNLPVTPFIQHQIYTGGHKPISMKLYRVPFH